MRTLVLAVSAWLLAGSAAPPADSIKVGATAPDFTLRLVDGSKVRLSDLRGQVVVLNFWATWCAPCKRELPLLDSVYRLRKDRGLRVFAITTEDSLPLFKLRKLFDVMAVPAVRSVSGPYRVMGALPTNYVIDRRGRVRMAKTGALELDDLNKEVLPLLNEPAPVI